MNVRTPYGRAVAVVAGAVIGLAGALAFRAPASAARPAPSAELTATSSCNGAGWNATFTLTTADTHGAVGIFSNVSIGFEASAYDVAHHMPPPIWPSFQNGRASGDGEFTEDWPFSRSFGSVLMKFTVTWHDGADVYTRNVAADAHAPVDCDWPPPPTPTPTPTPTPSASPPSSPTQPGASASAAAAPAVGEDTSGSGGGLPVTGAAAGTIAGAAGLLLIAGAALFVMARRRKVKFTA